MTPSKRRREAPVQKIIIIGGGLAGLSTAVALEQSGFRDIRIYERRHATTEHHGYGLTLTYDPQGILQKLGILEDLAQRDCPSRSHLLLGHRGKILGYFGNELRPPLTESTTLETSSSDNCMNTDNEGGWGQRGNLRVPRHFVRHILTKKLQHAKIEYGFNLDKVEYKDDQVNVCLLREDGHGSEDPALSTTESHLWVSADLLIGADGIRSKSLQLTLGKQLPPLQSLDIRLILGLSKGFTHPLLCERAFYTLAPGTRLFTMPYQGSPLESESLEDVRYMWQLSFVDSSDQIFTSEELWEHVRRLTKDWHAPVSQLIESTPIDSVWGTLLYDTSPQDTQKALLAHWQREGRNTCRYLPVGDALHAMSPFKGQGANHSLRDGMVLAQWLPKASLSAAVRNTLRELVQRTHPVVEASRVAALYWHSPQALSDQHRFAGIAADGDASKTLAYELEQCGIHSDTPHLLEVMQTMASKLDLFPELECKKYLPIDATLTQCALKYARTGDLSQLRQLSWKGIPVRRIRQGETSCLLEAARHGHPETVHWLVTQAGCDVHEILPNTKTLGNVMKATVQHLLLRERRLVVEIKEEQ